MSYCDAFRCGRDRSSSGHSYLDVHFTKSAKPQLGDLYNFRAHPFDTVLKICEGYSGIRIRTDDLYIRNVASGSAQVIVWLYA